MSEFTPRFTLDAMHFAHEKRGDLAQFNGVNWVAFGSDAATGQSIVMGPDGLWVPGVASTVVTRYKANDSATKGTDPDLQMPVAANEVWALSIVTFWNITFTDEESSVSWSVSGPTGATLKFFFARSDGSPGRGNGGTFISTGSKALYLRGVVRAGTNSGAFALAWGGSGEGTLEAGSNWYAHKLN